jgi:hypothetical protein
MRREERGEKRVAARDRPKLQNMKELGEFFGLFGRHL